MYINFINYNYLSNAILGYFSLIWYLLYIFGIFTYFRPKFLLTFIFTLNLLFMVYYLSSTYDINIKLNNSTVNIDIKKDIKNDKNNNINLLKLIFLNIILKLFPLISLQNETFRKIDIIFTVFIIIIYYIYIFIIYRKILNLNDVRNNLNRSSDINEYIYDFVYTKFLSK